MSIPTYFLSFSQDLVTVLLSRILLLISLSKSLRILFVGGCWWGWEWEEWETLCFLKLTFLWKFESIHGETKTKSGTLIILLEQCFLFHERHCQTSCIAAFPAQLNACVSFLNPSFKSHLKSRARISKGNVYSKTSIILYAVIVMYLETWCFNAVFSSHCPGNKCSPYDTFGKREFGESGGRMEVL